MEVTTHEAKTKLSSLLALVQGGEEVVICRGRQPVARLVPIEAFPSRRRPEVGTVTTGPVSWTPDAFHPLSDEELGDWGI